MNTSHFAHWLGIEHPVIQAPMAGSQLSALAIAVSNAGGLGSLPCAMLPVEAMRKELALLRAGTPRPYNVNFFCHTPPQPDAAHEARWRATLAPYFKEFGVEASAIPGGPGRLPFSEEAAQVLEEFKPAVVSFHFGLPAPALLARVKSWGAKVLSSATTVAEARWLAANGADAVIAQGLEAGGHRGMFLSPALTTQIGTFALLPQIVRAVKVPVIAAGGIADARGVAAALALGAAGVQVGTAYLLCPEATTSTVHRAALKREAAPLTGDAVSLARDALSLTGEPTSHAGEPAPHTALTNLFSGRPARGVVNRLMREIGPMSDAAPAFPLATNAITPLRAAAEARGLGDFSPLWCGQNASGCREIPAAAVTRELASAVQA